MRDLSETKVRSAKAKERPYKLADGGGLFLLVRPNGSRLWRWRFWLAGREQLFAVGAYPTMGLAEARKAVDEARELVRAGLHPAHERQQVKEKNLAALEVRRRETEGSLAKVASSWFAEGEATWAETTKAGKRRRLDKQILPALGGTPITKITPAQVRDLLAGLASWTAVYVKGDLDQIFRYAQVQGLCEANPVPALRGLVRVPTSSSKAALNREQIAAFFARLRAHRGYPETDAAFRLLALTVGRPGEVCSAEWSELDEREKLWRVPAEKMKMRRPHLSPLSTQALELLRELRAITGRGRYLFPNRAGTDHTNTTRLSKVMKEWALAERATPHCWRATFSTWANERGFRPDAIELALAHVERNKVRGTYNQALLLKERRELAQAWADYLAEVEAEAVLAAGEGTRGRARG